MFMQRLERLLLTNIRLYLFGLSVLNLSVLANTITKGQILRDREEVLADCLVLVTRLSQMSDTCHFCHTTLSLMRPCTHCCFALQHKHVNG